VKIVGAFKSILLNWGPDLPRRRGGELGGFFLSIYNTAAADRIAILFVLKALGSPKNIELYGTPI